MIIEAMLMTIEGLLIVGAVAGLLIGLTAGSQKMGCSVLCIIPVAMIFYISAEQAQNPESIRSTSALDFVFGPLWPSLGAIGGYSIGKLVRSMWKGS